MGFFDRLKKGLSKSRGNLTERVDELVENAPVVDDDFYEELTDILLLSDVGVKASTEIIDELRSRIEEKKVKDTPTAKQELMDRFEFSDKQAQAILDMRLARLTGLERDKLLEEMELATLPNKTVMNLSEGLRMVVHPETKRASMFYADEINSHELSVHAALECYEKFSASHVRNSLSKEFDKGLIRRSVSSAPNNTLNFYSNAGMLPEMEKAIDLDPAADAQYYSEFGVFQTGNVFASLSYVRGETKEGLPAVRIRAEVSFPELKKPYDFEYTYEIDFGHLSCDSIAQGALAGLLKEAKELYAGNSIPAGIVFSKSRLCPTDDVNPESLNSAYPMMPYGPYQKMPLSESSIEIPSWIEKNSRITKKPVSHGKSI